MIGVNDRRGIILDRTVFYATGGGQPGDAGALKREGRPPIAIATAVYGEDKSEIVHVPGEAEALPEPGETLTAALDWARRYRHMRIHTGLHLLSVVLPFPVTGGSIGADEGRLDFDIDGEVPAKDEIEEKLNALVAGGYPVTDEWITDEELLANPSLVKTMKVKPPMGIGPRPPGPHRRHRPAALRRHPCPLDRRDRPPRHRQDRKQGQAEPARPHPLRGVAATGCRLPLPSVPANAARTLHPLVRQRIDDVSTANSRLLSPLER